VRVDHARVKRTILWVLESHARMFAVATGACHVGSRFTFPTISRQNLFVFDKNWPFFFSFFLFFPFVFCYGVQYAWTLFDPWVP